MQSWQYTAITFEIQPDRSSRKDLNPERDGLLDELGADGWELVTVVPLALGTIPASSNTTHERWVFKRPTGTDSFNQAATKVTEAQEQTEKSSLTAVKEIPEPSAGKDPT
jgi:hypothetical protein